MHLTQPLLIGFALLALGNVTPAQAQSQTSGQQSSTASSSKSQPSQQPSPTEASSVSLDRIREGVMRKSHIELPDFGVPTFRVEVSQDMIKMQDEWRKKNAVGDYVRGPYFSNYHQDFLTSASVTGRPPVSAFGLPIDQLIGGLKKGFRDREAARVRAQVQAELDQIDPNRSYKPVPTNGSPSTPPPD